MTTATLARGPPVNVCPQDDDDDEDALMDEEDVGGNSPDRERLEPDEAGTHGLMIDDNDQDMNSDDGGDYGNGDIVDYVSTRPTAAVVYPLVAGL